MVNVEYQETQKMMIHYDNLIWTGVGFFLTIISLLSKILFNDIYIVIKLLFLNIILISILFMVHFIKIHGDLKDIKAERLKQIEVDLIYKQHLMTDSKNELTEISRNYLRGRDSLKLFFKILFTFYLIIFGLFIFKFLVELISI